MVQFRNQGPPPHMRPNWRTLNKGQKLYAIRQYNLGRARRNLPQIPYNNLTANVPRYIPDSEAGEGTSGGGSSVAADSIDTEEAERDNDYADSDVFSEHGSHIARAEDVIRADPDFFASFPSHNTRPMETNVSTGIKRGPETGTSADSTTSKKSKTEDSGMELPGTGGGSSGDPDTGNPSTENAVIPRPINNLGRHTMVFRKHHSLLSYGLAWKISKVGTNSKHYLTTTSMMSIPVEMPFLYLSPAEWNWCQNLRGLTVESINVKVVMRNPRTAFETNSSSTTLATLNQNKYLGFAKGLNITTR